MTKLYFNTTAKINSATGFASSSYIGSTLAGVMTVTASNADFLSPEGKKFKVTFAATSLNYSNGKPITLIPADKINCERDVVFGPKNQNGDFTCPFAVDNKDVTLSFIATIKPKWESLSLTADVKVKNKVAAFIISSAKIAGSGLFDRQEVSVDLPSNPTTPSNPTNPVPPSTNPSTGLAWSSRIQRQMLFYSAPNYYWPDKTEAEMNVILDQILVAGLDGISVEFGGMFIADEYNHIPTSAKVMDIFRLRVEQWTKWEAGLRKRGLIAHMAFLNSNQSIANKASDSEWKEMAKNFILKHGTTNKIILPLSESDTRTRASIGRAILDGLTSAGFPKSQLISHDGSFGHFVETHRGRDRIASDALGYRLITVNDNGPAIQDLYGSDWRNGGKPILENIADYARRVRKAGTSGAVYSFGKDFDFPGLAIAGSAWGSSPITPAPGGGVPPANSVDDLDVSKGTVQVCIRNKEQPHGIPVTKKFYSVKKEGDKARWSYEALTGWPEKSGKKTVNGKAHMYWVEDGVIYGGLFDWLGKGQTLKTLGNVTGGYFTRQPPKGATIYFCLISLDSKNRTNIKKCDNTWF